MSEIIAGQIWQQPEFPCCVRFVVLIPGDGGPFALLSDPRSQGSVICTDEDGRWRYTGDELEQKFIDLKYENQGQLKGHLIMDKYGDEGREWALQCGWIDTPGQRRGEP